MREVVRGVLAGSAGTALMTAWQTLLPRLKGSSKDGEDEQKRDSDEERWDQAAAPAQAARVVLRGLGFDPPASWIPFLTNAMHWSYGTSWGAAYALAQTRIRARSLPLGLGSRGEHG